MRVLDLDMDYFMTEIASTPFSCEERLDEEYYGDSVWTEEEVQQFLEQNLGLSKNHKIPGRIVTGHNEALIFWKELINSKMLSDPFGVVHVDSHADLGLGDASWSFLQSEFLTLPIDSRRKISEYEFCNKIKGISIGDYLLWAVAYRCGFCLPLSHVLSKFGYKKTAVKCSIFTTVCFMFYSILGVITHSKL